MGIDLSDFLVKPVKDHDDVFAFTFDFMPEGKALDDGTAADTVTEEENGDLIIAGWAAVFDGVDREGENFTEGAFQRGVKAFLKGPATLAYHHDRSMALGKILELEEVEGKGLRMKARVDGAIRSHPTLKTYYEQIKNGTLSALSVGGFFRRKLTPKGWRINDMDFTEISVTPVPVHPGTNFAVVAGKALASEIPTVTGPEVDEGEEVRDSDLEAIRFMMSELDSIFTNIERAVSSRKTSNNSSGE